MSSSTASRCPSAASARESSPPSARKSRDCWRRCCRVHIPSVILRCAQDDGTTFSGLRCGLVHPPHPSHQRPRDAPSSLTPQRRQLGFQLTDRIEALVLLTPYDGR